MSAEERAALSDAGTRAQEPDPIDLGSSDRALRRRLPALARLMTPFTEHLRITFSRALRMPVAVSAGAVELIGGAGAEALRRRWATAATMRWEQDGSNGWVALNHALSYLLVEVAYGTAPDEAVAVPVPTRERLTEVERQTLAPWLQRLAEALAHALDPTHASPVVAQTLGYPLQLDVPEDGTLVAVPFTLTAGEQQLEMTFVLLPRTVESLDDAATVEGAAGEAQRRLAGHLGQVAVVLSARLGNVAISLQDVLGLRPGAILWLESMQADPLPILVEDTVKFLAQPVARHGALGVEIIARVP